MEFGRRKLQPSLLSDRPAHCGDQDNVIPDSFQIILIPRETKSGRVCKYPTSVGMVVLNDLWARVRCPLVLVSVPEKVIDNASNFPHSLFRVVIGHVIVCLKSEEC
jgi:hypothetical protein